MYNFYRRVIMEYRSKKLSQSELHAVLLTLDVKELKASRSQRADCEPRR